MTECVCLKQQNSIVIKNLIIAIMDANRDREIREKQKQKDKDEFQGQLRNVMEKQEQQLNKYFKEFNKSTPKDPNVVKKSQVDLGDRTLILKQIFRPFTVFGSFYQFWNSEWATPEENYTHSICKKNMLKQTAIGVGGSLLITSIVSYKLRANLPKSFHVVNLLMALSAGTLYGAINSTRFTLEQFEKLGPGYELGNIVSSEVEKYRMDQPTKK